MFILSSCSDDKDFDAKEGVIDASDWNFAEKGLLPLKGEWEFYWQQLYRPEQIDSLGHRKYLNLPAVWNGAETTDQEIGADGFATFSLRIKGIRSNEKMGLRVPYHFTAYKLWVNGELLAENGVVGVTSSESEPQTVPKYVTFDIPQNELQLVLQISNFHFNKGGAPAAYRLGNIDEIIWTQNRQIAFDLILAGALFIMFIYHLGLYYLRRKEILTLYFSLVCLFVLFRTLGLGESYALVLFPNLNFEFYIKLLFIGFFLAPPLFILFIQRVYPNDSRRIIGRIFMALGILGSLTLFFPARISSEFVIPFHLINLLGYIYLLIVLIKALIKRREGSVVTSAGVFIMVVTVFNDILFDSQIINTDYYSSYGLFVFVFSQSFLLSLKFSKAFTSIENLSEEIKQINISNSRFVPKEFLSFLGKESILDVKLGDNITKDMTIFFADVRSFTTISETLTPEENFNFINSLLKRVSPLVRSNDGFIDKFMGDAIMALFPNHPKDAVLAAGQILTELDSFNKDRIKNGQIPIRLGIGINSGSLMLGTIGEEERMEGTVISDSVNLASRLEGLTKTFGANMIVSKTVLHDSIGDVNLDYRFLGSVPVKGKIEEVSIYDVFSYDFPEVKWQKMNTKELFERAIRLYEKEEYSESERLFLQVQAIFPEDKATMFYINRITTKF